MSSSNRSEGGGFFGAVDALVKKHEAELERVKAACAEHGFSKRVTVVPPGVWRTTRKPGRSREFQVVRGHSADELVAAMAEWDAGEKKTFEQRKKAAKKAAAVAGL